MTERVLRIALDYVALTDTGGLVFRIEDQDGDAAGPSRSLERITNAVIRAHLPGGYLDAPLQEMDENSRAVAELLASRLEAEAARLRFYLSHYGGPPPDTDPDL